MRKIFTLFFPIFIVFISQAAYSQNTWTTFVWEDLNGNGGQDFGEPGVDIVGLEGAQLNLWLDADGDGAPGGGTDMMFAPDGNDGAGTYSWSAAMALPDGDYIIEYVPAGGTVYYLSPVAAGAPADLDSDIDPATNVSQVSVPLTDPSDELDIDMGIFRAATIETDVWEDVNYDGLQPDALAIAGATATLYDVNTGGTATDLLGNNPVPFVDMGGGDYAFENVAPGEYYIIYDIPPTPGASVGPYYETLFDQDGSDTDPGDGDGDNDADQASARQTRNFVLTSGATIQNIDAGFVLPVTITTFVWNDENGDGIQDAAEPGITGEDGNFILIDVNTGVQAIDLLGNPVVGVEAGPAGEYEFADIAPGTYYIQYVIPADPGTGPYVPTQLDQGGDDTTDSDQDPDDASATYLQSPQFTVESDDVEIDIDAGFILPARISCFVWEDVNGDGIQDGGEPGIVGATATLFENDGVTPATDLTGVAPPFMDMGAGMYEFINLSPGEYIVQFDVPASPVATPFYPTRFDEDGADDDGTDGDMDSDADPNDDRRSYIIMLEAEENHERVDAGFYVPGIVGDRVFCDKNADGIFDAIDLDEGVANVQVTMFNAIYGEDPLLDVNGAPLQVNTDAAGNYQFVDVPPGENHQIRFTVPLGFELTLQDQGGDDDIDSDAAMVGPDGETDEFELLSQEEMEEAERNDCGMYQLITIGGQVWLDQDDDSQLTTEGGVTGVTVELRDLDGGGGDVTFTMPGGFYEFTDLRPGNYSISIPQNNFDVGGDLNGTESCPIDDPVIDGDQLDDGVGTGAAPSTIDFELLSGCDPTDPPVFEYVDFCFRFDCNTPNSLAFPTCEESEDMIICDLEALEGFCSRMFETNSGGAQPSPLCPGDGAPHNISWFAFVAGSGNYNVTIDPFACSGSTSGNEGVQIGIYTSCDFTDAVFCDPTCNTDAVVVPSTDLEPGATYYIFIDGCNSSVCSYTIEIDDYQQPPPFTVDDICIGTDAASADCNDPTVCVDQTVDFVLTGIDLEIEYVWSVDGVQEETSLPNYQVQFDAVGTYTVCLELATNSCFDFVPTNMCREITVIEIADEDFGEVFVCEGDAEFFDIIEFDSEDPNGDGTTGWQAGDQTWVVGVNSHTVTLPNGCIYEQSFTITEFPPSDVFELEAAICPGESYDIEGNIFYDENSFGGGTVLIEPGYTLMETDQNGCDSVVNLTLDLLTLGGFYTQPTCGPSGIAIGFTLDPIPPSWQVTYMWNGPGGDYFADNDGDGDPLTLIADQGSGIYTLFITIEKTFTDGSTKQCMQMMGVGTIVDLSAFVPVEPVIDGPESVCAGGVGTYTASSTAVGVTYVWDLPGGVTSTVSGDNDEIIEINWTGSNGGIIGVTSMNDCGTSDAGFLTVSVVPQPTASISVDPVVCVDSVSNVQFTGDAAEVSAYAWSFDGATITNGTGGAGPGPHACTWPTPGVKYITLMITDNNDCVSESVIDSVMVEQPIAPPVVTCDPTAGIGEVIFTWPDVPGASYTVEITSDPSTYSGETLTGTTLTVSGVGEGVTITMILTTETGTACNTVISAEVPCTAQNCVAPTVVLAPLLAELCADNDTVQQQITATITPDPAGTGTLTYSGPGVDPVTGIFDASVAGVGVHTISAQFEDQNGCFGGGNTQVTVKEVPVASFTQDFDEVCITDAITFMYTGTANPTAFFWDFGDVVTPQGGPMPTVTWMTPGTKTVRLTVELDGCTSAEFSAQIEVQDVIAPVVVSCIDQSSSGVEFEWNSIPGATGYSLVINGGAPVTQAGTSVFVPAAVNELVTIVVTPIMGPGILCAPSASNQAECPALDCPTYIFTNNMGADSVVCLDGSITRIDLAYTVVDAATGDVVQGLPTFGGDPNVDPVNQQFVVGTLPPGEYNVQVIYEALMPQGCSVTGNFTIILLEQPNASFTVSDMDICSDESVVVTFDGSGLGGAAPDWMVSGGTITATATPNEYEWTFPGEGVYTIDLNITNDICISDATQQTVTVSEPESIGDVMCQETAMGEITITWTAVSCATEYTIFVDGVEVATQTGTTYTATGLFEGPHDFEVQATSSCACEIVPGVNASECLATGCPQQTATLSAPTQDWCVNADDLSAVTIDLVLTGGDGSGTETWTGGGNDGTFDPAGLDAGMYTVYYSYQEDGCPAAEDSIQFTIFDVPGITPMPDNPTCYTDTLGSVMFAATGGVEPYTILLDGEVVPSASSLVAVSLGGHTVEIVDANGCSSEAAFSIIGSDPVAFAESDIVGDFDIVANATATYTMDPSIVGGVAVDSITWIGADGTVYCSGADCFSMTGTFANDDVITVTINYNSGCSVETSFTVTTMSVTIVNVTNVLTANGDNNNDLFVVFTNDPDIVFNSVSVYDRWGNLIQFDPGWQGPGSHTVWDGTFGGSTVAPGVYVYTMEYVEQGVTKRRTGDITVVR